MRARAFMPSSRASVSNRSRTTSWSLCRAERAGEPPQLVAERLADVDSEGRAEGRESGTKSPTRHAGFVHASRVASSDGELLGFEERLKLLPHPRLENTSGRQVATQLVGRRRGPEAREPRRRVALIKHGGCLQQTGVQSHTRADLDRPGHLRRCPHADAASDGSRHASPARTRRPVRGDRCEGSSAARARVVAAHSTAGRWRGSGGTTPGCHCPTPATWSRWRGARRDGRHRRRGGRPRGRRDGPSGVDTAPRRSQGRGMPTARRDRRRWRCPPRGTSARCCRQRRQLAAGRSGSSGSVSHASKSGPRSAPVRSLAKSRNSLGRDRAVGVLGDPVAQQRRRTRRRPTVSRSACSVSAPRL